MIEIDLKPKDVFRASGGPLYNGVTSGDSGLYRLLSFEPQGDRMYALAVPVDEHGVQDGGTKLLYVSGDEFTRAEMPGWLYRPYTIKATRSTLKVDGKTGKTVVASIKTSRAKTSKVKALDAILPKPMPASAVPIPASAPSPSPTKVHDEPSWTGFPPAPKPAPAAKPARASRSTGGMSILDAAVEVLKRAGKPMHVKDIAPAMIEAGLWSSPGKTPWKSLWAQMPSDKQGRFIKTGPGIFRLKIG